MFSYHIDDEVELHLLEERHAEAAFGLIDQNRQHLRTWMSWVKEDYSIENVRSYIKRNLQRLADNNGFDVCIFFKGEIAGQVGYVGIDWEDRKAEIGYWLGASFQGKGLVTKACQALIDHAFNELKLNRLEIHCAIENRRSRAIPERLGFTQEGILRQALWLPNRYVDLVIYGLLADEWKNSNQLSR